MGKKMNDTLPDQMLNYIKNNVVGMFACDAEPADYTAATTNSPTGNKLAGITGLTAGDFTGPVNGDTSGRKLTINAQTGDTVDITGTATHVALVDGSALLYVTTTTSQALTSGNTLDYPAWDVEIADPT